MLYNDYLRELYRWPLPIEPVPDLLNPFKDDGVDLHMAICSELRGGSHKFITVLGMWRGAVKRGALNENVHTVITASSGRTAHMVAMLAHGEGRCAIVIIKQDLPTGKRDPLDLTPAKIVHPAKGENPILLARSMGGGGWKAEGWQAQNGCLDLDQYGNMDGAQPHAEYTAQRILQQFPSSKPTVFFVPIGTGGLGAGLRMGLPSSIRLWGALCKPGHEIPGCRDEKGMEFITIPSGPNTWSKSFDGKPAQVSMRPSYLASLWLNWELALPGLIGPSGGLAYLGALCKLQEQKRAGTLDKLRDSLGRISVVILSPDGSGAYGDRYKANLPSDYMDPQTAPMPWSFPGDELW